MFGRKKAIPPWASMMKPKEYDAFIQAVEQYFKSTGEPFTIGDGMVVLAATDSRYGLENILRMCAQCDPANYLEVVKGHFQTMEEAQNFTEGFDKIKHDFEKVREYIGVRLYDESYIDHAGADAYIKRHFAGELYAALVYDFPHHIANIAPYCIKPWGKTEDELFAIGMENIRRKYHFRKKGIPLGEDTLYMVEEEHFFVPNILLHLKDEPMLVGKHGTIAAVPNRGFAALYPFDDQNVSNALGVFFTNVPASFESSPGALTREVYWIHDGGIEVLDYGMDGDQLRFTPPKEFLAILEA